MTGSVFLGLVSLLLGKEPDGEGVNLSDASLQKHGNKLNLYGLDHYLDIMDMNSYVPVAQLLCCHKLAPNTYCNRHKGYGACVSLAIQRKDIGRRYIWDILPDTHPNQMDQWDIGLCAGS